MDTEITVEVLDRGAIGASRTPKTSPRERRRQLARSARSRVRRALGPYARCLGTIVGGLLWPILRLLPWRTVWVINPGSQSDLDAYVPSWAQWLVRLRVVWPAGVLFVPGSGWSLVLGSTAPSAELRADVDLCQRLLRSVKGVRCRRIALNGDLPAIMSLHDIWPANRRFVRRQFGTVYMVERNVREAAERLGLAEPTVLVVGVGYTGAAVANHLASVGYRVLAADRHAERQSVLDPAVRFTEPDSNSVGEADIAVLLTPTGDGGAAVIEDRLGHGTAVISDTHPKLSRDTVARLRRNGVQVYESALTRPGSFFFPKIPRWPTDTIPGCVCQSLVESRTQATFVDQDAFNENAEGWLLARLDEPPRPRG